MEQTLRLREVDDDNLDRAREIRRILHSEGKPLQLFDPICVITDEDMVLVRCHALDLLTISAFEVGVKVHVLGQGSHGIIALRPLVVFISASWVPALQISRNHWFWLLDLLAEVHLVSVELEELFLVVGHRARALLEPEHFFHLGAVVRQVHLVPPSEVTALSKL